MSSPKKTSKVVNSKQELIMKSLHKFYKESDNIDKLLKIVNGESKLSLRIIDWFVTNYTKERGTIYYIPKKNNNLDLHNLYSKEATDKYPKPFMVNARYKSQLDGFQKKLFDPFCRRKRIIFKYNDGDSLETTVAQLNFFKWAIEHKILDYIKDKPIQKNSVVFYIAVMNQTDNLYAQNIAELIRKISENFSVLVSYNYTNLKVQLKKADKLSADYCVIIGEEESKNNSFQLKNMNSGQQEMVLNNNIEKYINVKCIKGNNYE